MACNSCFSKGSSLPAEMWRKHATYYGSDWQSPSWPSKMTERNAKAGCFFPFFFSRYKTAVLVSKTECVYSGAQSINQEQNGILRFYFSGITTTQSYVCTIHVKWLIDSLPNAQSIDFCAKTASRRLGGVSLGVSPGVSRPGFPRGFFSNPDPEPRGKFLKNPGEKGT